MATTTFRSELLLAAALVLAACSKPTDAPASAPAASSSAAASPVAETDAFRIELKASGPFKKGEAATFLVRVNAKGPFHINDEYPVRFKSGDAAGVRYPEPKLERSKHASAFATEACAGGGKDACVLTITVGFTPEAAGTVHLSGTLDVSVCNKDQCLIEKRALDLPVQVS